MEWLFYILMALLFWALPAIIVHGMLGRRLREQQEQMDLLKTELRRLKQHLDPLQQQTSSPPVSAAETLLQKSPEPAGEKPTAPEQTAKPTLPAPPPFPSKAKIPPAAQPKPVVEKGALDGLLRYFTGERALVRWGVMLVLFGMGFLLKLTVSEDLSVPLKLGIAASCAGVLFGWGWQVRRTRKGFSVALQGGALGILYFMVYASSVLYNILPFTGGLLIWLLVGLLGGFLALRQNAQVLAVLSVVGGFLAPILMRSGSFELPPELMVQVFTYYALLNAGIVWLSFVKLWRSLNVLGYLFTFLFGALWGVLAYRPEAYPIAQPFLILFFVMYTVTPLVHALRRRSGRADHILMLSVPVLSLIQQAGLMAGDRTSTAISSLVVAGVQYGLSLYVRKKNTPRALQDTYQMLAIGFAALAVPLLTTALATSVIWTFNGVLLTVFGTRAGNRMHKLWGLVLLYLALAALLLAWLIQGQSAAVLISLLWVSLALLGTGIFLHQNKQLGFARGLLLTGATFWILTGASGAEWLWPERFSALLVLFSLNVTLLVLQQLGQRFQVALLSGFAFGLPLWAIWTAFLALLGWDESLTWPALLGWGGFFVVQYLFLAQVPTSEKVQKLLYLLTSWLLFFRLMVVGQALLQQIDLGNYVWVLVPLLFYWGHLLLWERLPFTTKFPRLYRDGLMLPLQVLQTGVFLLLLMQPPAQPYRPLLNILEVAQLALFLTLLHDRLPWKMQPQSRRIRRNALIVMGLLGVSAVVVRFMHAYFGAPWNWIDILGHNNTQTVLSIFWSAVALTFTVHANRKADRDLWTIGAGILVFVVFKLFVLDLSGSDTWARVISFLGVGVLLLFMGFVAPVPPRRPEEEKA